LGGRERTKKKIGDQCRSKTERMQLLGEKKRNQKNQNNVRMPLKKKISAKRRGGGKGLKCSTKKTKKQGGTKKPRAGGPGTWKTHRGNTDHGTSRQTRQNGTEKVRINGVKGARGGWGGRKSPARNTDSKGAKQQTLARRAKRGDGWGSKKLCDFGIIHQARHGGDENQAF